MVIVDTSFILSLMVIEDTFHKQTVKTTKSLIDNGEVIVLNNFVVSELLTLSNNRFKELKQPVS